MADESERQLRLRERLEREAAESAQSRHVPGRTTLVEQQFGARAPLNVGVPGKATLVREEAPAIDAQQLLTQARQALTGAGDRDAAYNALVKALASHGTALPPEQAGELMEACVDLLQSRKGPAAVAARGVADASSQLPFYDQIQASFGRHDISGVRAQVGGEASAEAKELGARAYATGDRVAFGGTPDLHTAAHEAAHVVQQRAGVALKAIDGGSGDAHEQHADAVADAVVRGESAEALLSSVSASHGSANAGGVVQRDTKSATPSEPNATETFSRYVAIHAVDLGVALDAKLKKTIWPDPTEDTPFAEGGERAFTHNFSSLMREQLFRPEHLAMMLYPGDVLERFQRYVVGPGQLNSLAYKGFGEPLAQLVELAAKDSLTKRMGPRYAQLLAQMVRQPKAEDLIAGHPIDPLVARAMCEPGILQQNVAAVKDIGPPKLNAVEAKWLGHKNAELWNFVQVTPPTASPEEVAAALWGDPKKTTMAFAVEKFGDLFRVAPAYARQVIAGRYPGEVVGTADVDASRAKQMLALAKSGFRHGDAATQQFAQDETNASVSADQIADLEAHIGTQLDKISAQLAMVAMDKLIQAAYEARRERQKALTNADAATRNHWLPVLSFQHTQLLSIAPQLPPIVQRYQKVFAVLPFGDTQRRREHDQLQALLKDYGAAVAVSHLRDESTAIMRRIELRQKQGEQNELDAAAVDLHDANQGNESTGGERRNGNDFADDALENQRQRAQNKSKSSRFDREKALTMAGEYALQARMDSAKRSLAQLQEAADAVGFGDGKALRTIIPNAKTLPEVITDVRDHLTEIDRVWDDAILHNTPEVQEADSPDGWADWQARAAALPIARNAFAKIAGDQPLADFFRSAIKKIQHQQLVNALVSLAEALLITLVTGAGAAAIGRAAATLAADGGRFVAFGVDVAANASVNSMVQMAMSNDGSASLGWTMLENGLMDVFTRGLLHPMQAAENAARLEAEQIAALPNLTDAERRAVSSVSFTGTQAATEFVTGMVAQWAAHHIVDFAKAKVGDGGGQGQGVSDSFALTAVQQGAAIGLGKFFHGRLAAWEVHRKALEQTRFGTLPEARALFSAREEFFTEAKRLSESPSPDPADAERLNQRNVELLQQERKLLEAHAVEASAAPLPPSHDLEALTTVPVLDRIENVTGVEKGPAYAKHMAELRGFYEDMAREGQQGVAHRGHAVDGAYGWEYGHKAFTFSHGLATFEVRVHLDDSNVTANELATLKTQVHAGVDKYYNAQKHQIHGADGVQRQMHVEVIFVEDPQLADIRVMAHPGNGRADLNNWYVGGNPTTHAHEVTHGAFGIKDEYHDSTGNAPDRATPTSPGVRTDQSIMGNHWIGDPIRDNTADPRTSVKQRHLDEIGSHSPAAPTKTAAANTNATVTSPQAPEEAAAAKAATEKLAQIPVAKLPAGTQVDSEADKLDRDTYYVTPEHGQEMLQALASLAERGVQTRAYKKGFIVRRGSDEWYFEFHADATRLGAQRSGDARDPHGLPPPNAATVELWGFRGVRTIKGRARSEWTEEERLEVEAIKTNDPLLYAGHVGISVDGGKTIIGFTPARPEDMDMPEFLQSLFNHDAYPGVVDNDTAVFDRARQKSKERGWNTEPISVVELVDKPAKLKIAAEVARMSGMKAGEHGFGYSFPLPEANGGEHFAASNEYPADRVRNCAAFPGKVGVPIPEPSGNLSTYLPELQKWAAEDAPKDFRTKKDETK